jgi:hypothetical protein
MGDFAQVFGGLLHSANQKADDERKKYETGRDADVSMYKQIMLDPHAGLGPDADASAVEERRVKLAGDIAKLQNLKGKDTPLHHLAEMLNGVRRAAKSKNSQGAAPGAAPPSTANPQPQGTSGGGLTPLDQSTQKVQDKTQSLGGKILTKVAHGLGAGLSTLEDATSGKGRSPSLPSLDASVMPNAPTREQDAKTQQKISEETHTNSMKQYRDDLKQANPRMSDDELDRAVETKYGAVPKPKMINKKVADPDSPTGYSYVTSDEASGQIMSRITGAPSTDSSSVSEQIVIDPNTNQLVAVPVYRSTSHPKGASPSGSGAPASSSGKKAGLTPLQGSQKAPASGGATKHLPGGARVIGSYVRPQQFNTLNTQATAIDEARNSLVGDDPKEVGGLAGDLGVFDNPDSVQRIMQYLGFVEKNISGEGQRATGSGPMAAVEWYTQLPVTISNLQQQAQQELGLQLQPEEQKFVTDYFRVMGTIGGLRAATKMPGARWSFMNLYNELPTPGRVNNKADARKRIENILQETNVVSKHNPLSKPSLTSLDGDDTKQFRDKGKVYKIPSGSVAEFKKDHPSAQAVH